MCAWKMSSNQIIRMMTDAIVFISDANLFVSFAVIIRKNEMQCFKNAAEFNIELAVTESGCPK